MNPFANRARGHNRSRHMGLTLLELVVVLAILIALAAIVLPMLPDLVGKGNQASGTTNLVELEKLIQTHKTMNFTYPDGYDSLLTSGDTVTDLLPSPGGSPLSGAIVAGALDTGQVTRLSRVGITRLFDVKAYVDSNGDGKCDFDATRDCYDGATRTLANGVKVAFLVPLKKQGTTSYANTISGSLGTSLDAASSTGNSPDSQRFMVVGLGSLCSMVGVEDQLLKEAPVAHHHKALASPQEMYSRFGLIFDCGPQGGTGSGADARFVGAIVMMGQKLFSADGMAQMFQDGAMDFR